MVQKYASSTNSIEMCCACKILYRTAFTEKSMLKCLQKNLCQNVVFYWSNVQECTIHLEFYKMYTALKNVGNGKDN